MSSSIGKRLLNGMAILAAVSVLGSVGATTAHARRGGSDIGGTDGGSAPVLAWCDGIMTILGEARSQARMAQLNGDKYGAIEAYRAGIDAALMPQEDVDAEGSLTYQALQRGQALIQALEEALARDPQANDMTLAFMAKYYDFVMNTVSAIDMQYNIPYEFGDIVLPGAPSAGKPFDIVEFERRFVVYTKAQVQWVIDQFTRRILMPGSKDALLITPRWSTTGYLKLLELVTAYAAEDLTDSVWAAKYACARQSLQQTSGKLAAYNSGNRFAYSGKASYAVSASYSEVMTALSKVENGCRR